MHAWHAQLNNDSMTRAVLFSTSRIIESASELVTQGLQWAKQLTACELCCNSAFTQ